MRSSSMAVRAWGVEPRQGPKGAYWSLRTGRGHDRIAISLGYVTAEEAARAKENMNREEAAGRGLAVREWHARNREQAVEFLVGDPVARELVKPPRDPGGLALRDYYSDEYAPWREKDCPGGWKQEERVWRRVLEELGGTRVRDLDAHGVADYLDALVARSGERAEQAASGNSKRLHRAAIQALLTYAYRHKHIETRPDLAVFRIRGATKSVIEKPDPLSLAELVVLMEKSAPMFRTMWAVAAGQGLRPSELNRIRWEDVDLEEQTLRVRGTKTDEAAAVVPLTPLAVRELRAWWTARGTPTEGLAFPSKTGEAFQEQGWKKPLKEAAAAAKIERRVYPCLLRDSFATIAWLQGIPLDVARRVMRHAAESRVLEDVYCRPRPADLVKQLERFDLLPESPHGGR